jgi:hypothetical protein
MPTKYLVLRTNAPVGESFIFASPRSWGASQGATTDLAIETVDGHEADVGGLRADPRNVAVLDAEVVLSLIEPKSQAPAAVTALRQVGALKMPEGLLAIGAHTSPFTAIRTVLTRSK